MSGNATTLFAEDPRIVDIDDDTVDLVFLAEHQVGGRTKASVAVPRGIANRRSTIETARANATNFCRLQGAGGPMSLSVLMSL